MLSIFEQLRKSIGEAQLEIGEKGRQSLILPAMPAGQFDLLRTVLWNAGKMRFGDWKLDDYAEIIIDENSFSGLQEIKQRLLRAIDTTHQTFSGALTINDDALPAFLYERLEPIDGGVEHPEEDIEYMLKGLLRDIHRVEYIDCQITPFYVPQITIIPKEQSEAAYRDITEEELNAPKRGNENEFMIKAAGYSTGNNGLLSGQPDDYVGKKLHSIVLFGEGGLDFLERMGLKEALMKKVEPLNEKRIYAPNVPFGLTM